VSIKFTLLLLSLFPPWQEFNKLNYEFQRLYNRHPVVTVVDSLYVRELEYEFERLYHRIPVLIPVEQVVSKRITSTRFILPTRSSVVCGWYFYDPRFPRDGPQHTGVDYACELGEPIYAAASGTVVWRGWEGDFGNQVRIQHANGWETRYCHLSAFGVGGWVNQGTVIGYCGITGLSTGSHLHFEVRHNGVLVNPLKLP